MSREVPVHPASVERRHMTRNRVLLGGVIADADGENAIDCSILDVSASGAKIQLPSGTLQRDSEIYLVDTRNEMAHLATVVWTEDDRTGLSFVRSYSLALTLPLRLAFLGKLLVHAKLRQVQALTKRGVPVEEAIRVVGLSEAQLERIGKRGGVDEKTVLLLRQAKRLMSK
jgi:hypothetical protein